MAGFGKDVAWCSFGKHFDVVARFRQTYHPDGHFKMQLEKDYTPYAVGECQRANTAGESSI